MKRTGSPSRVHGEEAGRQASQRLIARCQRGDQTACDALLEAYRPLIYTLVRSTGRDPDWVEDTVVEILVQLYRSMGSFRGHSSFSTWVYSVATRVCAAELRKAGRHKGRTLDLDEVSAGTDDPVALAFRKGERQEALGMIAQLPEKHRVAVVLRHVMGCSYPELAEVLGVPLGTAKTRVFTGMQRIRRMIRERGGEGTA